MVNIGAKHIQCLRALPVALRCNILMALLLASIATAITVELPSDTPYKDVSGNTITTADNANWIYPNYSLHHYILKIPTANLNVQTNNSNYQWILTRGNLTLPTLYPITGETTHLKTIGTDGNGTNTTRNYTIYTGGAATNTLNTATARSYIVEFQTEPWVSGHYNLTAASLNFDPDVTACGDLNSAGATYTLKNNISGADPCIRTLASVTFNLNGFAINSTGTGLDAASGSSNISNGTINANGRAVYLESTGNILTNLTVWSNSTTVSSLTIGGSSNNIINTTITSVTYTALDVISGSSSNTINTSTLKSSSGALLTFCSTCTSNKVNSNNFTNTSGAYVTDSAGGNSFNSTTEGNLWFDVANNSLTIFGTVQSTFPSFYVGTYGKNYPYNSTQTSKVSSNVQDFLPLTLQAGCTTPNMTSNSANGGTATWNTPQYACTNDSNFTTATFPTSAYRNTTYLNGTNWNFSIASDATINGITATVCTKASVNSSISDTEVKLIKNGTIQSTNRATGATWIANGITCYNYGNSTDLWGTTWTPADWNNNSSGIVIAATNRNTTNETFTQNVSILNSKFDAAITENFTTSGDVWTWSSTAGGTALQTGSAAGWLVSSAADTSTCTQVTVVFQSNDDDMDTGADGMYYWKNSSGSWNLIADVGRGWGADSTANEDIWLTYNNSSNAAQYMFNGFRVNYSTAGLASTENWWIDNVTIYCNGTAWRINSSVASIDFVNLTISTSAGAVNGTPYISTIAVYPTSPTVNTNLSCNITPIDATNATVNASFEWYKNGTNQTALAGSILIPTGSMIIVSNLTTGNLSVGQNWSCNARLTDYTNTSSWNMSANRTIGAATTFFTPIRVFGTTLDFVWATFQTGNYTMCGWPDNWNWSICATGKKIPNGTITSWTWVNYE